MFKDKVWTSNGGGDGVPDLGKEGEGTANRFAGFMDEGQGEELIVPGKGAQEQQTQENAEGPQGVQAEAQAST